jgi:hypothetical protein
MILDAFPYSLETSPRPGEIVFRKKILPPQTSKEGAESIAGL